MPVPRFNLEVFEEFIVIFFDFAERLLGDRVKIRAYRVLARQPEGITGRGLASLIGTSPFKINHVLRELVSEGIVEAKAVGKSHLYRLNQRHVLVKEIILFLTAYEDRFLKKLGQEIMRRLDPKPLAVVLYGSVARGEETAKSDIDLCLIYADSTPHPGSLKEAGEFLSEWIARTYGNPVSVIRSLVSEFQIRSRKHDPLIRTIVKEGRAIAGLSLTEIIDHDAKKD